MICKYSLSCLALFGALLISGCASEKNDDNPVVPGSSDVGVEAGKTRFYIPSDDLSTKTVIVNGNQYKPRFSDESGSWYVDVDESSFDVYSAQLVDEGSGQWYGESPVSDIIVPSVQFAHKTDDLASIPLLAEYDRKAGKSLVFVPPYATLEFELSGMDRILSLRLSADDAVSGKASWRRSTSSFVFDGCSNSVVLNCTGRESNPTVYSLLVLGHVLENVCLRVCDSNHHLKEFNLGRLELAPGTVNRIKLDATPDKDQMWYEGFDLCVWGGDAVEGNGGVSPTSSAPDLHGDISLGGYEYANCAVNSSFPGSGYIQYSFAEGSPTVSQSHEMSDSYINSRAFDANRYMLRCRECPGYLSVGTGSTGRGVFSIFPLKGIETVNNLEVTFSICLDRSIDDAVQFNVDGSSSVIRKWFVNGVEGSSAALSQKGTRATLTIDRANVGGAGQWKTVKLIVENCTDATFFEWQGASTSSCNHGFYLDDIAVKAALGWTSESRLRILYWNIQNGMWADQAYNYEHFVEFVKKFSPDICVWVEAKTNYHTGSETWMDIDLPSYLPDNWETLAKRYGHDYVAVSRRDLEAFPQVITSRYPVTKLKQMNYLPSGEPIFHGAGIFRVGTPGGDNYFVTLHLNPYPENDNLRLEEIKTILGGSVMSGEYPAGRGWFVLGDFNSHSSIDAANIGSNPERPQLFAVHDYVRDATDLIDFSAVRYPDSYISTTSGKSRFDYIYMDSSAYSRIFDAGVITTSWTDPVFSGISNFYNPSDHRPILLDLEY